MVQLPNARPPTPHSSSEGTTGSSARLNCPVGVDLDGQLADVVPGRGEGPDDVGLKALHRLDILAKTGASNSTA